MQRILSKRVLRDIRENLLRYLALFFLVALVMYMVVAIVGAAETIMQGTKESGRVHHREDGQFGVFVPLTEKETAQITEKGVTLQRDFSLDFHLGQSTFRVYQARESVDLFVPAEGEEIPAQGEILLEQHYAEKHELQLGDIFIVGGKEFTVTGIGSTPDYDAAFEKTSDTTVDSNLFGFGFVTAEDYEALKAGGQNFRTEDYTYTYLLNDTMTDQELKELLQSFELDRSKVTDTYFLEMLADAEETKNDIQDGIQELLDGVDELVDGVDELADHNTELTDAADELFDAMLEQVNDSLKDAGVEVTLTSGNYEQQLNAMIANPHAYTASLRQDLQDAKKSLEDLQEFRDGVKSYTDGVNAASAGGGALVGGMSQITENSATLNQGADAIFNAILGMVNEQLQAELEPYAVYGISFSGLTAGGYGEQLDQLATVFTQMGASQAAGQLSAVKSQLDTVAQFRDGVKAYTAGVGEAAGGSQKLFQGLSVLYTASEPLVDGTDAVVNAWGETDTTDYYRDRLLVNMERARWQYALDKGKKYVVANVAAFMLQAINEETDSILEMRICVGSVKNKTPLLSSRIYYMELNPYWNVPQSIIRKEIIPTYRRDTTYFTRNRMKVYDNKTGLQVDPHSIKWAKYAGKGVPYTVKQDNKTGNSLGRIIFRFPNPHSVYLHDTPSRWAFTRKNRAVSHGCVRLQKALDFSFFLLNKQDSLLEDRIRIAMDIKPVTEEGKKLPVSAAYRELKHYSLEKYIPLFIDYL